MFIFKVSSDLHLKVLMHVTWGTNYDWFLENNENLLENSWKYRWCCKYSNNTVRILMRWWENVLDCQRSLQVHLDEQKLSAGVCLYFSHSHEQSRVLQFLFIWMHSVNTWSVRVYLCVSSHCFSVFCWLTGQMWHFKHVPLTKKNSCVW